MRAEDFRSFSKKQLTLLNWWCESSPYKSRDAIICDGAVRSGKTVCMSLSFTAWAFYRFSGSSFAFCGKTITSLRRNVITPLLQLLRDLGFECRESVSKNYVDISRDCVTNRFYLFGGRDAAAGLNFHASGDVVTPLGAKLIKAPTGMSGQIIALDKSCALEMVTAGDVLTEYDKLIDRQLERAAITEIAGFSKIITDASKLLSI